MAKAIWLGGAGGGTGAGAAVALGGAGAVATLALGRRWRWWRHWCWGSTRALGAARRGRYRRVMGPI